MNAAVLITIPTTLVFLAAIMLLLPAMMPPTLPLGVSVPADRQDEPIIGAALRRYRWMIGAAWFLAVIVVVAFAFVAPIAASIVGTLLFVAGAVIAYIVARQGIVRAKHDGQWYRGVPVRPVGSVTVDAERAPVPFGWFAASILLLAIASAIGVAVYDTLPRQVPTHWGIGGTPDAYADKSVWSVFAPVIIGLIVVIGVFALSFLNRVAPVRALASASGEQNALRARGIRAALSALIGQVMFVIALALSWSSVASWLFPDARWAVSAGAIGIIVLVILVLVAFFIRWRRLVVAETSRRAGDRASVDVPDDDRFWKAGILYINSDDPAIMVQRRFGVGWTMNLGHPAGIAIGVAVLAIIIGAVAVAVMTGASR